MTIDGTVKELLRAARDATTLEDCRRLRLRAFKELDMSQAPAGACRDAIARREERIIAQYETEVAAEARS